MRKNINQISTAFPFEPVSLMRSMSHCKCTFMDYAFHTNTINIPCFIFDNL